MTCPLSLVIPTWREGERLRALLLQLQPLRADGAEIIVVDGQGDDRQQLEPERLADHWLQTLPGRSHQLRAGADLARGRVLAFVHADSVIDARLLRPLLTVSSGWGFFCVQIQPGRLSLCCVARAMNLRSKLTQVSTGDQIQWVTRELYTRVGGFPEQLLMEDVALSKRLRAHSRAQIFPGRVLVDGRRWLSRGVVRTVIQMWWLRLQYWWGADPDVLAAVYYPDHPALASAKRPVASVDD